MTNEIATQEQFRARLSDSAKAIQALFTQDTELKRKRGWVMVQVGWEIRKAHAAFMEQKRPEQHWVEWIERNAGGRKYRAIRQYEEFSEIYDAADDVQRVALFDAGSVRDFRAIANGIPTQADTKESRQRLPYMEGLHRLAKFFGLVKAEPILDWPEEGRAALVEDAKPILIAWKSEDALLTDYRSLTKT